MFAACQVEQVFYRSTHVAESQTDPGRTLHCKGMGRAVVNFKMACVPLQRVRCTLPTRLSRHPRLLLVLGFVCFQGSRVGLVQAPVHLQLIGSFFFSEFGTVPHCHNTGIAHTEVPLGCRSARHKDETRAWDGFRVCAPACLGLKHV